MGKIMQMGGAKFEIEEPSAKRIEKLVTGSKVKVLRKTGYSSEYKVQPGVVVGFEPFPSAPTVVIAVLDTSWNDAKLEFVYLNEQLKDVEVIAAADHDAGLDITRADVLKSLDREIERKRAEVENLERRREFFVKNFDSHFPVTAEEVADRR